MRSILQVLAITLAASAGTLRAEPFVPTDPQQVLLRVAPGAAVREGQGGSGTTAASLSDALRIAAQYIDHGRRTEQPAGFGRAEAILEQWREQAGESAPWHILSADIRQYRHEYSQAIALLQRALEIDPRAARAYLMRASIQQTRGDFAAARADCAALLSLGEGPLASVCLAQVLGLAGHLERARNLLLTMVGDSPGSLAQPQVRIWMLEALADMEDRLGNVAAAERAL
ncbi:MAG: hypothetical protein HC872_04695, partial [Gammaproteobacteria bacterium]|nr:hypothetical protein [Gammaproteobacteria bacterium]